MIFDPSEPTPSPSASDAAAAGARLREQVLRGWQPGTDMWLFAYASLIWRPDFDCPEQRPARIRGYHRALKMWSHVNRGTPQCPGLVFALLPGGSCRGLALRVPADQARQIFEQLWLREMPTLTYIPRWLRCETPQGPVQALAFTLPRSSPGYTGLLSPDRYREVFAQARGCFGITLEYAHRTHDSLRALGIEDDALARLLALTAPADPPLPQPRRRSHPAQPDRAKPAAQARQEDNRPMAHAGAARPESTT